MSWGSHMNNVEKDQYLLYSALLWAIAPFDGVPIDYCLEKIMVDDGGFGGDPGWEIERISSEDGVKYKVWTDFDVMSITPNEKIFSESEFNRALLKTLIFYGFDNPEKKDEINNIIEKYKL